MLLAGQIRRRFSWPLTLICLCVLLASAALVASPYMAAIGGLTKKKSLDQILPVRAVEQMPLAMASLDVPPTVRGAAKYVSRLVEAMHPVLVGLAVATLGIWLLRRTVGLAVPRDALAPPNAEGAFILSATVALTAFLLIGLYVNYGYISHRHVMLPALLLSGFSGAGVLALSGLARIVLPLGGLRRRPGVWTLCITGGICIALLLHALRPLHEGKGQHLRAAAYLQTLAKPDDYVLTDSSWVIHYGGFKGLSLNPARTDPSKLFPLIRGAKAAYFVISEEGLDILVPDWRSRLQPPAYALLETIEPDRPEKPKDRILVFQVLKP